MGRLQQIHPVAVYFSLLMCTSLWKVPNACLFNCHNYASLMSRNDDVTFVDTAIFVVYLKYIYYKHYTALGTNNFFFKITTAISREPSM